MTSRKIEYWVIPPEADAEFVASMEEVLDTYVRPYDPACPVLCMDEQPPIPQQRLDTFAPDRRFWSISAVPRLGAIP